MVMSWVWTILCGIAFVFAILTGHTAETGAAALQGARAALELALAMTGSVMLWSGLMELLQNCGLAHSLSRALRPVLFRLFPTARRKESLAEDLSYNLSANLLGLGNAATPAGVRAACELHRLDGGEEASDELCRLVVLNTASVQLLPTTVAALRAAMGAEAPFDILPAVWFTSLLSVSAGLLSARMFAKRR